LVEPTQEALSRSKKCPSGAWKYYIASLKAEKDVDELHRLLTAERIGQAAVVVVLRGYEKVELRVVPEEAR
jgi:hypothetical protein